MKSASSKVKKDIRRGAPQPRPRPGLFSDPRRRESLLLGGIVAITGLVYLRCLSNGYVFDDHEMIIVNRYIGDWSFLWKAFVNDSWWFRDPAHLPQSHYYRPLQDVWLGLNYQLFGLNPIGPHALMVMLHLGAVVLVFGVAARLASDSYAGLAAALLFGLLPVHAEAVIWATAIPESLAGALQLGAFYLYLRFRDERRRALLIWSLALFGAALLSHESAITFPALVAAHCLLFDDRSQTEASGVEAEGAVDRLRRRIAPAVALTAPFIVIALLYLAARFAVLGFIAKRDVNNHATLAQIILTIPTVIAHNLEVMANPWLAGPSHRIVWVNHPSSPDFWMPAAGLALIALAGFIALGDSPRRKLYLFATAWVFITMAPMLDLGILYPNALVADRYLYLSSFGLCLMAGQALVAVARSNRALVKPAAALAALAAVIYGANLWRVQRFWHDEIALFSECIARFPDSGFCHNRLGMALQGIGNLTGAQRELALAFRLDPHDYAAEYDLAMVHEQQGKQRKAADEAADALSHLAHPPPSAYVNLATLYDAIGDADARESAFSQAARLPGGVVDVAIARARLDLGRHDGAGAERLLRPTLADHPDDPRLLLTFGSALAIQHRYDEALAAYQRALRIVPGNPTLLFLMALTLHNLGRNQEALAQCRLVLQATPTNPNAIQLLRLIERDLHRPPSGVPD